jgi:hypothetical protein
MIITAHVTPWKTWTTPGSLVETRSQSSQHARTLEEAETKDEATETGTTEEIHAMTGEEEAHPQQTSASTVGRQVTGKQGSFWIGRGGEGGEVELREGECWHMEWSFECGHLVSGELVPFYLKVLLDVDYSYCT